MTEALERLARALNTVPQRLSALTEEQASSRPAPGRWSAKEILGHLIDSASNNHQRFVRAQLAPILEIPSYEQDSWVGAQGYLSEPWSNLVALWTSYNYHLLHVMRGVPAHALAHTCVIGGRPPVTLDFVMADYVRHLEHHIAQIDLLP
jgi:hypothetical protein